MMTVRNASSDNQSGQKAVDFSGVPASQDEFTDQAKLEALISTAGQPAMRPSDRVLLI